MSGRDNRGRFTKGNKIGPRYQPGKSGNPAGNDPRFHRLIKGMPKDAKTIIYDVLWTAMAQPDINEAKKYLDMKASELPECGFILQLTAKSLMGKNGWQAFMDICDRLFGKPKQTTEIEGGLNLTPPAIIIEGEEDDAD